MTDPIADMLARIRNAIQARKASLIVPASLLKERLAQVLVDEGFLSAVSRGTAEGWPQLSIDLRYDSDNRNAITGMRRVSRPGQRVYANTTKLPKVRSGLGTSILTTSRGVMTDRQARKQKLGGEVLCEVW